MASVAGGPSSPTTDVKTPCTGYPRSVKGRRTIASRVSSRTVTGCRVAWCRLFGKALSKIMLGPSGDRLYVGDERKVAFSMTSKLRVTGSK